MRQQYLPTQATRQHYQSVLNDDLGVYKVQSGAGIGGFLKKMIKYVVPIGKSLLGKGLEMAKPELKKLAAKGIDAAQGCPIKSTPRINPGLIHGLIRTGLFE